VPSVIDSVGEVQLSKRTGGDETSGAVRHGVADAPHVSAVGRRHLGHSEIVQHLLRGRYTVHVTERTRPPTVTHYGAGG